MRRRSGGAASGAVFVLASLTASVSSVAIAGEQTAAYRASGAQSGLFDQYDNDGYSLSVASGEGGVLDLRVRVVDAPLESAAPYPTKALPDRALSPAPEREAFAREKAQGSATQAEAVRRLLVAVASEVRYDADRDRNQDPAAVFASRRAYCVGYAELAVDLLRRIGISARTVQGVLRTEKTADRYDPAIGGVYHRWIEVWYPDRGYAFSDPAASVNGIDARYIPFDERSLTRPKSLTITEVQRPEGVLGYSRVPAGTTTVLIRASAKR
ncbi:MAG TPA: transglutaminase-like domain-containing protein [Thermoanaerobaculia bacterium]|nr:transglutaminase-like domain-containing protein [Thermoanaerobaculia bacterium]